MATSRHGQQALDALDEVLRERPHAEGHAFSAATAGLAALRDEMIDGFGNRPRAAADRQRLERVNAIISVVLAGHFPLGSVPWHEIEAARGWLAEIVSSAEAL